MERYLLSHNLIQFSFVLRYLKCESKYPVWSISNPAPPSFCFRRTLLRIGTLFVRRSLQVNDRQRLNQHQSEGLNDVEIDKFRIVARIALSVYNAGYQATIKSSLGLKICGSLLKPLLVTHFALMVPRRGCHLIFLSQFDEL